VAGTAATGVVTVVRDGVQQHREAEKRRADKFKELVAAVYEFDWLDGIRLREVLGRDNPQSVSPFAKLQSISSVYFPQFDKAIRELDAATLNYRSWMEIAPQTNGDGFEEAYNPYVQKRDALLDALRKFAREEFQ
jgi:hypothetical protein